VLNLQSKKIKKGAKMLTEKMYNEMLHDFNNGGIKKNYPNLSRYERIELIKHFAKSPLCPCDLPHKK
jgi:hypothetical protein